MKKIISLIGAFALTTVIMTGTTFAAPLPLIPIVQVGTVQGLVRGPGNTPLVLANIQVVCHDVATGNHTQNTLTDGIGFYYVVFPNHTCVVGDGVTVTATKGGVGSGTQTGIMQLYGTFGFLELDIAVVNVPVVPEFGLITGALTLVTSAGSVLFLKRRV